MEKIHKFAEVFSEATDAECAVTTSQGARHWKIAEHQLN